MELRELIDRVVDQESFLVFVRALAQDRRSAVAAEARSPASPWGADAGSWQNISVESFLEAAASWAEDSNFGADQGLGTAGLWKRFAVFLYCGKIYE